MKSLILLILSAVAAIAQPVPTNVVVIPNTNGSVTASWGAVANAANYWLYIGYSNRTYSLKLKTTNTFLQVTNLPAGVQFYFAATAANTNGIESDYSNEATFTIQKPASPPGLQTTMVMQNELQASRYPEGPWETVARLPDLVMAARYGQNFYRLKSTSIQGPFLP